MKKEMYRLVMADLPIEKYSMNTDEAVALFHELGMKDKEKLFRYRRSSRVNIYERIIIRIIFTGLWYRRPDI